MDIAEQKTVPPPPAAKVLNSATLKDLTGTKLSHYEVGPMLARAQSGLVFKATDFKNDREVAFKVLWPEFTRNDDEMQRFVRAMKTMLPLRHPNLVALYGAGKTGPYCWIAMEYVEGDSLTRVCEKLGAAGMVDWRKCLRLGIDIAQALEYAHEQNVIHRNITPQNILIQKADNLAKLGDLMLAKAQEGTLAQQITKPGEILGDIRYMSPERTGGTAHIDGRSDIYSLGAVLYLLLTGRPPCEGNSLIETIQKIRSTEPERPKKYQLSVPVLFEGVVTRMLAKRPENRYATATDLLKDLDRVIKFSNLRM
jgi:serine/threonine-protein kinase